MLSKYTSQLAQLDRPFEAKAQRRSNITRSYAHTLPYGSIFFSNFSGIASGKQNTNGDKGNTTHFTTVAHRNSLLVAFLTREKGGKYTTGKRCRFQKKSARDATCIINLHARAKLKSSQSSSNWSRFQALHPNNTLRSLQRCPLVGCYQHLRSGKIRLEREEIERLKLTCTI